MTDEDKNNGETQYEIAYLKVLNAELQNRLRQTEDLLRLLTEQYRRITEVVSDYIFSVHIVDGNPIETVHGRGCLTITGFTPEEFSNSNFLWINMVHESDRALVLRHVAGILSGRDTAPFEHRIVRKDGTVRWVRNTPVCQYDAEGKLTAYDGLIQDVTDHKLAEEALQRSEEKYRIIADFTYDWEEWLGTDGHYVYVSPSCERVTGYRPEEFLAQPDLVIKITHPADRELVRDHYKKITEEQRGHEQIDFRIIKKNGEECWITHSCQPVYGETGEWLGRRASNHDISRRRRLLEELTKARELEAVGILAGGIAHDFNNLLTAILGNISMSKMHIPEDNRAFSLMSSAEKAALRSQELTQQLILFSRRSQARKKILSVAEVIQILETIEKPDSNIRLTIAIPEDIWLIDADEGQLVLALRSMLINAREAMDGHGEIRIGVENVSISDRDAIAVKTGDYVKISISDTGKGIQAENTSKIFDPYFTTKDAATIKGTGLGLAIAYSVINGHEGFIVVDSEVGRGTTMNVYLPASNKTVTGS